MIWASRILRHDRETQEHLELLFDINPDAVQITRWSDGCVVSINKSVTTMTGYAPQDMIGRTTLDIDLWENPVERQHVLDELEKKGYCKNQEATFRRKDGSLLVGLMSSTLFSYQGKPHVLTVTRDITDKKKIEEQVRHLHKADSLGRMAGAIAHLFNNQLNVVMGNLQLAMDDLPGDSATQEFLTEAMQATRRSSDISGRMLTYLGRSFGTRERLDLSEVCGKTLPMLRHAIPKSIVIETDLMTGGPVVNCNFSQLQQVVINLLTNAIEAIGEQNGTITLATNTARPHNVAKSHFAPADWQPKADTLACLEVTDTGCGMATEDLDKLFDPFFTTKFIGRGLGLPVVFGIVKAFDGVISVESRQGQGSTFRVYLPLVMDARAVVPEDAAWSRRGKTGGTVLLVDDQEAVCRVAERMINRLGYTVLAAHSGGEAIDLFYRNQDSVCCVITDLTMPGMDGWETIAALRKIKPDIPIILASGYDEARAMARDDPEQPQVFLHKPYSRAELENALNRAMADTTPKA